MFRSQANPREVYGRQCGTNKPLSKYALRSFPIRIIPPVFHTHVLFCCHEYYVTLKRVKSLNKTSPSVCLSVVLYKSVTSRTRHVTLHVSVIYNLQARTLVCSSCRKRDVFVCLPMASHKSRTPCQAILL